MNFVLYTTEYLVERNQKMKKAGGILYLILLKKNHAKEKSLQWIGAEIEDGNCYRLDVKTGIKSFW